MVASKSAFSTDGRVIDKFRSSLTPKTAEGLICSQDWLRPTPTNVEDMKVNDQQLKDFVENLAKIELGKKWFTDSLEGLYNIYYAKYGNPTTTESSSGASSSRASGGNQMSRLLNRLKKHTNKKARSDPLLSSEYERHVYSDFVTHLENSEFAAFDLLGFWKAKESIFPVRSRMAMDIISVQATSVASESAFSTSGRVLSIRRTRLTPTSLEMCMCLKDHLDAQERKQDKSGLENPIDFEEEILDAEVQQNEAIPLSDE
ncbi:zinc finger BED domain-containing protein RICESLEEPER 2-like protein [Tanacetum coccineum]